MNGTDRREFLKGTVWMGLAAVAAGCTHERMLGFSGAPMQGFAMKPIKKVRVACIGVGKRGMSALRRISLVPGTEVVAVDVFMLVNYVGLIAIAQFIHILLCNLR